MNNNTPLSDYEKTTLKVLNKLYKKDKGNLSYHGVQTLNSLKERNRKLKSQQ